MRTASLKAACYSYVIPWDHAVQLVRSWLIFYRINRKLTGDSFDHYFILPVIFQERIPNNSQFLFHVSEDFTAFYRMWLLTDFCFGFGLFVQPVLISSSSHDDVLSCAPRIIQTRRVTFDVAGQRAKPSLTHNWPIGIRGPHAKPSLPISGSLILTHKVNFTLVKFRPKKHG